MKVTIKKAIVEFKSKTDVYDLECKGLKPNTARELTPDELKQIEGVTHIRIMDVNGQRCFERELSNIYVVDHSVLQLHNKDNTLCIFSWMHTLPQIKTLSEVMQESENIIGHVERCG